ncbi:hypothetical protein Tco_0496504 [Tanacetum coccineum]
MLAFGIKKVNVVVAEWSVTNALKLYLHDYLWDVITDAIGICYWYMVLGNLVRCYLLAGVDQGGEGELSCSVMSGLWWGKKKMRKRISHKRTKNKAKNDKTEHGMERAVSAYDFFVPGPLPGYDGNPDNNNGWIEADVPLLGELGAEVDEPMVGPVVDEIAEPIVEMEEQVIALVIDVEEDIAMLFGDDDFSDDDSEGFEDDEEV